MKIFKTLLLLFTLLSSQIGYSQSSAINEPSIETKSFYVPAVNGTRLAVDVHFPKGYKNEKLPALLELTRYWRSSEDPVTGTPNPSLRDRDLYFISNDYILVKVDVRGTGASYGVRPGEYSPIEVKDAAYIVEWVINQPWSDGSVGAYGTSYSGTTAELLCATGHKAIKAVIPGWSDFDIFESPGRPYGLLASSFITLWSRIVGWLDHNDTKALKASVRRVNDSIPVEAIAEHKENPNVLESAEKAKYKDSRIFGSFTQEECSPIYWKEEISRSKVPMLVLTSWLDAGTAEGTLLRFKHYENPQKVVLMPTSHGGSSHASPFLVSDKIIDPVPSVNDQLKLQLDFFDHHLKGIENGAGAWPNIKYYNLGEEVFLHSDAWPPEGHIRERYYLNSDHQLLPSAPIDPQGMDEYKVDFSTTTGQNNRWTTQIGEAILNLDHRNETDSLMLTYTTAPLTEDLQITGTPYVSLNLSSSHPEGAILVYLEDVDQNGRSRYITEGGLLLEHRKLSEHPFEEEIPHHSFYESDASPMPVNKIEEITFKLWPTSVLIKKGHSIRIAVAGGDKDTFDRVPSDGNPVYKIYRNKANVSYIDLPVVK